MTREEILALNLQAGERVLLECSISCILPDSAIMLRMAGQWIDNDNIHSIRRVEPKTELIKIEQPNVESYYISLEDFNNQKAYERKIYAFRMAGEFAEKGEEMPEDLRNEIAGYISKSPESEPIETEIEGIHYVLDIDGDQMRVGDKCERVEYPEPELKGILTIKEIIDHINMKICGIDKLWDPKYFRKVN